LGNTSRLEGLQWSLSYIALCFGGDDVADRVISETLAHVSSDRSEAYARGNEGLLAVLTGDLDRATRAFRRELELARRFSLDGLLFEALEGLAAVLACEGRDLLAAKAHGAADAIACEHHEPALADRIDERCFGPARARLGEGKWIAAHEAGRHMALDEALRMVADAFEEATNDRIRS
jgi:hypothetical protein